MTRHHLNIIGFVVNCIWITLIFKNEPMMWVLLGAASLLFLIFLSLGILLPNRNYFLRTITHTNSDKVLLTFDDGPDELLTPKILDTLKRKKIGAIFFIIGEKASNNPQIIKRILSEGHLIGNHTQNHNIFFATLNQEKVEKEIGFFDNNLIQQGINPGHLFRPPVGYTNPRIARAVKKMEKQIIGWSLRSYDSVLKEEYKLLERVTSKIKKSDIVLFHDNLPQTEAILEQFINNSVKNGINFAKTEELKSIL